MSGAKKNCFFHCIAAHYLSHGLELPEELFINEHDGSFASLILAKFSSRDKLLEYFTYLDFLVPEKFPSSIPDKVHVLGILFRAMIGRKLSAINVETAIGREEPLYQRGLGLFEQLAMYFAICEVPATVDNPNGLNEEMLASANTLSSGAIFEVLKEVFPREQFLLEVKKIIELNKATPEESRVRLLKDYWKTRLWPAYIKHLSSLDTPISAYEAGNLLRLLNIPSSVYAYTPRGGVGEVIERVDLVSPCPPLEMGLAGGIGHYYYFTNDEMFADDYSRGVDDINRRRAAILREDVPGRDHVDKATASDYLSMVTELPNSEYAIDHATSRVKRRIAFVEALENAWNKFRAFVSRSTSYILGSLSGVAEAPKPEPISELQQELMKISERMSTIKAMIEVAGESGDELSILLNKLELVQKEERVINIKAQLESIGDTSDLSKEARIKRTQLEVERSKLEVVEIPRLRVQVNLSELQEKIFEAQAEINRTLGVLKKLEGSSQIPTGEQQRAYLKAKQYFLELRIEQSDNLILKAKDESDADIEKAVGITKEALIEEKKHVLELIDAMSPPQQDSPSS